MNNYHIKAMTTPTTAKLIINGNIKTVCAKLQAIKATAPKGATFINVLKSITEANR